MKKFKLTAILLALLLALFTLSACTPNNDDQPNDAEIQDPISEPEDTEEPDEQESIDENDEDSPETIEKTGTYVGLMDSNSCEITIDGNPTPFRLSDDVKSVIDGINPNEEVKLSYYENEYGQLVLTEIEKAE